MRIIGSVGVSRGDAITLGQTTPLPWPAESAPPGSVVVRIGREPDNDLVVDLPTVSGHHARVVWEGRPGEARIEDLGSANGTALGSPDRKITASAFFASETIYLGSHPLPAALVLARIEAQSVPKLAFRGDELVIGRDPGCDRVVDLPMISSRHARLARSGDRIVVEDLGSSNGTFVNGRRIDGPAEIKAGDSIGLGSYTLLLAVDPEAVAGEAVAPTDGAAPRTSTVFDGRLAAPWGQIARNGRLLLLLVQAPLIGIVLGMSLGASAMLLSWLGLAAVWFGLSDAVLGDVLDARRLRDGWTAAGAAPFLARVGALASLCVVQCVACWAIAAAIAGLRGPGLPSVGLLILAGEAGLAIGLLMVVLVPRPAVAWAILGPTMLVLWLFSGAWQAPFRMAPWARAAGDLLPSRWVFEGLLLLEAHARADRDRDGDVAAEDGPDLAEAYFPAETGRTGPRGAAMALGFLLVGLSASAALIARASRRGRGP